MCIFWALLPLFLLRAPGVQAEGQPEQREKREWVALKNNLVYDAAATPNLQLEFRLADRWSIEAGVGINPFPLDDSKYPKWRHVSAHLAPRYWFCNVFNRDFVSINAAYVLYNVAGGWYPIGWMYPQVKESRYEGHAAMAGASYGWHFAISPHFSIELEAGVDAGYAWYSQYECKHCGDKKAQGGRWLVLPKVGINLSIPLGGDEQSLARRCDCEKIEPREESQEPREESQEPREESQETVVGDSIIGDTVAGGQVAAKKAPATVEPVTTDLRDVSVFFDVNVSKLDRSFLGNDQWLDSLQHLLAEATSDPHLHVSRIRITGLASFDGSMNYNIRLAGRRAESIKQYIQGEFPQLYDSIFSVYNGGEDWDKMRYQLQFKAFDGREDVLRIIATEPDADKREGLIKRLNGGKTYVYMRDVLKEILRSLGIITIYCDTNVE